MHDALIASSFVLLLLVPCIVATRALTSSDAA